jgi:hypothetical protein
MGRLIALYTGIFAVLQLRAHGDVCVQQPRTSLWQFLEDSDLSIYQIAERVGTSGTILSMWLAGTAKPHRTALVGIERILNREAMS